MQLPRSLDDLRLDLRHGARALAKRPGFTAAAVLTLALGIGANSALFSLVSGILLQPLPYPEPDRLVQIWATNAGAGREHEGVSSGDIKDWRQRTRSFEGIAGWYVMGRTLTLDRDSMVVRTAQVSEDFFAVAGTPPRIGRTFTPEETARAEFTTAAAPIGEDPVVVLSHRLWTGHFNADPSIIGRQVSLERRRWMVIGVMPPEFALPDRAIDAWIPWSFAGERTHDQRYLTSAARLVPGVSLERAQQEMVAVTARLARELPDSNRGWSARLVPLHQEQVGAARTALLVLLGAVGLVLLVACANVASLQLARGAERQREIAVRLALGASRARIVRQLMAESLLLSLGSGTIGAGLALWSIALLKRLQPTGIPRLHEVSLDPTVLAFTLVLTVAAGLLFGLAPALAGTRVDLCSAMKEDSGRGATAGPRRQRLRAGLVIAEVALAMVLLAGAGLLVNSFARLTSVDPGFDAENVLVLPIFLAQGTYDSGAKTRAYYDRLEAELQAVPGVESVGGATVLPMSPLGPDFDRPVWREGDAPPEVGTGEADIRMARSGYFRTMGMSILRGRGFTDEDVPGGNRVIVVNETLARRHWPDENPVGKRLVIDYSTSGTYPYEVVGVVNDIRFYGLRSRPQPELYIPHAQRSYLIMNMAVKTATDARAMMPQVQAAILRVDPEQPAQSIVPLTALLGDSLQRDRFAMLLLSGFAVTALILAAIGIFGLLSYVVSQRSFEIGVRMALGAAPGRILALVIGRGAVLVLSGVLIGALVALAATRLLSGLLFQVEAGDPLTFAGVALLLSCVALAACWGPARRATRVNVVEALRCD